LTNPKTNAIKTIFNALKKKKETVFNEQEVENNPVPVKKLHHLVSKWSPNDVRRHMIMHSKQKLLPPTKMKATIVIAP